MRLTLLPGTYAICRLEPREGLPSWVRESGEIFSITITREEVSVVCPSASAPQGVRCDRGWAALRAQGPLPLQMSGVLSALADPLAEAGVPIFAISTYDTDYLLVKQDDLPLAKQELERFGHSVCLKEA